MHILVAEDNGPSAVILERLLRRAGHTVDVAGHGVAALKALKTRPYDAMITDWMMPEMDGIELIRQVRRGPSRSIFIMMVTSVVYPAARDYVMTAGADAYIQKPFGPAAILNELKVLMSRAPTASRLKATATLPPMQQALPGAMQTPTKCEMPPGSGHKSGQAGQDLTGITAGLAAKPHILNEFTGLEVEAIQMSRNMSSM